MFDSLIREVRFFPQGRNRGACFILRMFEGTPRRDGKEAVAYILSHRGKIIFKGDDFGCSSLHAVDSDDTVKALMGFLTLRPGDTDSEYFDDYTTEQLEYCSRWAESLSMEVYNRFGED